MQRRTVLGSMAALLMLPFVAFVPRKKVPPPRANVVIRNAGYGLLEVKGTPEQCFKFYQVYQETLWPSHKDPLVRKKHLKAQEAIVRKDVQNGSFLCYMYDRWMPEPSPDIFAVAAAAAVKATGCMLPSNVATVIRIRAMDRAAIPVENEVSRDAISAATMA